jgi:sugar diacid utilization regulator
VAERRPGDPAAELGVLLVATGVGLVLVHDEDAHHLDRHPNRGAPSTLAGIATTTEPIQESGVLREIIFTVGSSLDLSQVLASIVHLLSGGPNAHNCFVWLLDDTGERLELRASSTDDEWTIGEIALERGEGLAWWALEHREVGFIPDHALDDPRTKIVRGFNDRRFEALICVPIYARDGRGIGVISLHCGARELPPEEVDFLSSTASLVAGAIENARLYEETRRRVHELEELTRLGEEIAQADTLDELLPAVVARAAELLGASSCHLYLLDTATDELRLRASTHRGAEPPQTLPIAELAKRKRRGGVAAPMATGEDVLGLLVAEGSRELGLAQAVANQAAVAIEKISLIDRLTERNLIKDFFEKLARGQTGARLDQQAATLGCDLAAPHLVLAAVTNDKNLDRTLARLAPGSVCDWSDDSLRALLRVPPAGETALVERLRTLETPMGLSNVCRDVASYGAGFEEARHALLGAQVLGARRGVMTYEELGPYKYLLRMSLDLGVRDSHREALAKLAEYDRQRQAQLLRSLEEFLHRRGNISATAEALYIHPNTLRQRLRRIQELCGIDLRREDWLMIEIAVKLVRIQQTLGADAVSSS